MSHLGHCSLDRDASASDASALTPEGGILTCQSPSYCYVEPHLRLIILLYSTLGFIDETLRNSGDSCELKTLSLLLISLVNNRIVQRSGLCRTSGSFGSFLASPARMPCLVLVTQFWCG
jgi:hypothetical protein